MSNLDEKLDKIIEDSYNRDADLLLSDDFRSDKHRQRIKEGYQATTKAEIKRAFSESGYHKVTILDNGTALAGTKVMTGSQWYDRFNQEIDSLPFVPPTFILTKDSVFRCARRASGIEEEK